MPRHLIALALSLLFLPLSAYAAGEATRKINILFLGNSFTARHDIAGLVEQILEEGDPTTDVQVQRVIYGGQNMFKHSTYYFSQSFIEQSTRTKAIKNHEALLRNNPKTGWDYVVLQSWRDVPERPNQGFERYATKLAGIVKAQGAEVVLYMDRITWRPPSGTRRWAYGWQRR